MDTEEVIIKNGEGKIVKKYKIKPWIDRTIEEPIKELVQLLRDNGFNTVSSCGHNPNPYIQMEWYDDYDVSRLYVLLVTNDYFGFVIRAKWEYQNESTLLNYISSHRTLEVEFNTSGQKEEFASIDEIRRKI